MLFHQLINNARSPSRPPCTNDRADTYLQPVGIQGQTSQSRDVTSYTRPQCGPIATHQALALCLDIDRSIDACMRLCRIRIWTGL